MSRQQLEQIYFQMLKDRWEKVDKNSLQQIRQYNEWKRQLRKSMLND